jgi:hypothetical protein
VPDSLAGGYRIVLNPFFFPRSFYFPGPFINYYPPSTVFSSGYYPPSDSYEVAPPPPSAPALPDLTIADIPKDTPRATKRLRRSAKRTLRGRQKRGYQRLRSRQEIQNP